ncbi:MAG: GAF domain-containing protein [Erysipelotrichaceae bacterium]
MSESMMVKQIEALLEEENILAALCNVTACLNEQLEKINWVGFYMSSGEQLILGPFQGKVACTRIPFGKGVCGSAAATKQIQVVKDVHQFAGHIACDGASNSEIVLPIIIQDEVWGVLDIDSYLFDRFSEEDTKELTEVVLKIQNRLAENYI